MVARPFVVSDVPTGRFAMASWLGSGPPDDPALVEAVLGDLQGLQQALRETRSRLGPLLAARPPWLPDDIRAKLLSIENACKAFDEPTGKAILFFEKRVKDNN